MEGVLLKWTNYIEFWKERKFVIKGPILSYYTPESKSNKPKRRIFLGLANIIDPKLESEKIDEEDDDDFGFEIDTGADHYYIRAKNNEEKQKWINGLKNGKMIGEKLIRDMNKNNTNSKKDKFEQFKKIYEEKIKNIYKNHKQLQIILKQFDNIINFIEGKEQLKILKLNNAIINTDNYKDNMTNINANNNHKNIENCGRSIEVINTDKKIIKENVKKADKIIVNNKKIISNKKSNLKKIKTNQKKKANENNVGRFTHVPTNREKKLIEEKPEGRLTVSINNFTERGYLLKGEEFFDMDESFISKQSLKEINKFKQSQNIQKKK